MATFPAIPIFRISDVEKAQEFYGGNRLRFNEPIGAS